MILEEQRDGDSKAYVAYDRRSSGAASRKDALVIDGTTGRVRLPQQEVAYVSASAGAEAANAIEVACALVDAHGSPITGVKSVRIVSMPVTDGQGDLSAAAVPVGTLTKANNPVAGDCSAWMKTDADGEFSFTVTNTAAEENLVTVQVNDGSTAVLTLTFA